MPDNIRPAMFRKRKEEPQPSGAGLFRSMTDEVAQVPRARYGEDVADRAAERLNILRSTDKGPFMGHSGGGGTAPAYRRTTVIEEHRDDPSPSTVNRADVLEDRRDQTRKLGY